MTKRKILYLTQLTIANAANDGNLVYVDGFSVALVRRLTWIYILVAAVFAR